LEVEGAPGHLEAHAAFIPESVEMNQNISSVVIFQEDCLYIHKIIKFHFTMCDVELTYSTQELLAVISCFLPTMWAAMTVLPVHIVSYMHT
jgi:hypothetical protein